MSSLESRRIVLADPHATSPARFIVGGQVSAMVSGDIKMYEWRREEESMSLLGLRTEMGQIKSLAWSPSPAHRHLLATGLAGGKTLIFNLSPSSLSLPVTQPNTPQLVATLTVKHTRPVTNVVFSKQDPNYLATGLDRHRSDSSLLVWDLHDSISSSMLQPDGDTSWSRPETNRLKTTTTTRSSMLAEPRPIQAYCPSEQINSVAFVPTVAHELLASAGNKVVRLFDLRSPVPRDAGGGMAGASAQWMTRAVHGISPNPSDQHLFASYEALPGQNSTVRLWDSRKTGSDILGFEVPGSVLGLSWLDRRRLGVGSKEAGIGVWDVVKCKSEREEWVTLGGMRQIVKPKPTLHNFAFTPPAPSGAADVMYVLKDGTISIGPVGTAPVLTTSSHGDIAISTPSLTFLDPDVLGTPMQEPVVPHRPKEDPSPIYRRNKFQLPPERITAILAEHGRSRSSSPVPTFARSTGTGAVGSMAGGMGDSMIKSFMSLEKEWYEQTHEDLIKRDEILGGYDGWRKVLGIDVGVVMRRRASEGYGLNDLLLNAAIASKHPGKYRIAGAWEFIDHLTKVMAPSISSSDSYNLTHQSIYPIWTSLGTTDTSPSPLSPSALHDKLVLEQRERERERGREGRSGWSGSRSASATRSASGDFTPRERKASDRPAQEIDSTYLAAIQALNSTRSSLHDTLVNPGTVRIGISSTSARTELRRLILTVCGETVEGGKEEVERLVNLGERSKAAFKAFFKGDESETVKILMSSKDQNDNLLGSTIAGFMSQSASARGSEYFNTHWHNLVSRVDDPYVRAILGRIGGDDWEAVLEEENIPLLDRIAVGVQHLDDREFSQFLRGRMNRFTRSSHLHMLPLTGLSPPALSLLSRYLARTGDIQTVTLLAAYFPPTKLNQAEKNLVERWRETYRDMLDSWGMWGERCEFDVKWGELQRSLGGVDGEEGGDFGDGKAGSCPVCNNPLSKDTEHRLHRKNAVRGTPNVGWPSERTTVCVYCQIPLPRCVICLLHVDPHRPPVGDEDSPGQITDTIDAAYVFCLTCRHGGHASHILPWFEGGLNGGIAHSGCPVAGCDCECANI